MIKKRIGIYIKQIDSVFDNKCNKMLKKYGITHSQFKVLTYLLINSDNLKIKQIDLEQIFLLSNPTMTGIIQRLENNGFIKREKDKNDSRSNTIIICEKSFLIKDELIGIANLMEQILTKGMTLSELDTAYDILDKILKNILEEENLD